MLSTIHMASFTHVDLMHFCAKVQPRMHADAYCSTDTQTQTVIHWPTELQKTKELQNKSDHRCHLSSLSVFFCADTKAHISWNAETLPSLNMIWCTEMYISHPRRMQDNISLKWQISLHIQIPSLMSGHIQRKGKHKSRQLQDTSTYG